MRRQRTFAAAIVGAGPAGIGAALQLRLSEVPFCWLERHRVGGLLHDAHEVRNYPGVPNGLSGAALAARLRASLRQAGVFPLLDSVVHIQETRGVFRLQTASGPTMQAHRVICASGTVPKPFDVELPPGTAQRVHYDLTRLRRLSGQHVCIVGAGDLAFDYATTLARRHRVTILARGEKPACSPHLWREAARIKAIGFRSRSPISWLEDTGESLRIACGPSRRAFVADHLLVAIGRLPALAFLDPSLRARLDALQRDGRFLLAGDVGNGLLRQAAIAAGDGVRAAMRVTLCERNRG